MRVSVAYRSTEREVYNRFILAHPDIEISYQKWKEVVYDFNYAFRDYILETGEKVKMPHGLGSFTISKKKVEKFKEFNGKTYINLPIDWAKTRAAGKKIYNFNSHTDGYRFKWYWFLKECRFYQSEIWNFKPSRVSSRKIAEYVKVKGMGDVYNQWQIKNK